MTETQLKKVKKAIYEHDNMLFCPQCNKGFYDFTEDVVKYFLYTPSRTNIPLIGIICECGYVSFVSAKRIGVEV